MQYLVHHHCVQPLFPVHLFRQISATVSTSQHLKMTTGPSCVIEEVTDAFDPTEFDKHLGDMLIKHEGNAEAFLGTVFNFLKRKTNFFKEGDPKKRVLDAYKQVPPG